MIHDLVRGVLGHSFHRLSGKFQIQKKIIILARLLTMASKTGKGRETDMDELREALPKRT